MTSIVEDTFYGCTDLTLVTIPDSVTRIFENAFMNTGVPSIVDGWLLRNSSTCPSSTIPNTVKGISDAAFYGGCFSLTSVTIPDSVTSIGDSMDAPA